MRYLLAIVLPPVAVLLCGRPLMALLNLPLCLLGYVPGIIHACLVVNEYKQDQREKASEQAADRRQKNLVKSMRAK